MLTLSKHPWRAPRRPWRYLLAETPETGVVLGALVIERADGDPDLVLYRKARRFLRNCLINAGFDVRRGRIHYRVVARPPRLIEAVNAATRDAIREDWAAQAEDQKTLNIGRNVA